METKKQTVFVWVGQTVPHTTVDIVAAALATKIEDIFTKQARVTYVTKHQTLPTDEELITLTKQNIKNKLTSAALTTNQESTFTDASTAIIRKVAKLPNLTALEELASTGLHLERTKFTTITKSKSYDKLWFYAHFDDEGPTDWAMNYMPVISFPTTRVCENMARNIALKNVDPAQRLVVRADITNEGTLEDLRFDVCSDGLQKYEAFEDYIVDQLNGISIPENIITAYNEGMGKSYLAFDKKMVDNLRNLSTGKSDVKTITETLIYASLFKMLNEFYAEYCVIDYGVKSIAWFKSQLGTTITDIVSGTLADMGIQLVPDMEGKGDVSYRLALSFDGMKPMTDDEAEIVGQRICLKIK